MNEIEKRLALRIFEEKAVQFGAFKLKHHDNNPDAPLSPLYFNLRTPDNAKKPGPLSADLVSRLGGLIYNLIYDLGLECRYIAGIPRAGEPFALEVHQFCRLFKENIGIIKLEKLENENENRRISGIITDEEQEIIKGSKVVLIDDLITKADSKFEAIKSMEDAGLKVENIVVIIDREQGGADELKKAGYSLHSIFKISDLLAFYLNKSKISYEKYNEALDYIQANR